MKKIFLGILAVIFLSSCWGGSKDIINPDARYQYFYGATCPHCQELNKKLDAAGGVEQYSVEKREVYFNSDNNILFLQTAKDTGIDESRIGVPFVLDKETGSYAIGVDPAFNLLTGSDNTTGITIQEPENEETWE